MREAVCIASGPSLRPIDCARVRVWRDAGPARGVVVTNNTFRLCPWSDALYAMDNEWWRVYGEEVRRTFEGATYSRYGNYGTKPVLQHGRNSGAGALLLAAQLGAKRILMLGYDCKGNKHWHANHKKPLGNCESQLRWPEYFRKAKDLLAGVEVINCTEGTALDVFPLGELAHELSIAE